MDAEGYLAESARRVDAQLERSLEGVDAPVALREAMSHLLFPAGKRVRPAVVYAASRALGGPAEAADAPAVAVELIHTYSLIHDDLPCMDDDDTRRGSFVTVRHPRAGDAVKALRERGVFTDARGELLRIGPAPYLTDEEIDRGVAIIGEVCRAL